VAGDEPVPIAAGWAVLPLAGHVVRGSRRGRTLGAGSTACPQDASVAGPGSQVDGEREPGAGARQTVDGEVLVAECAVHRADVWGGTAPGMVSCTLTFGSSAVVCRHEPNRYHPRFAARKMSPGCVRLLHAAHPASAHCVGKCFQRVGAPGAAEGRSAERLPTCRVTVSSVGAERGSTRRWSAPFHLTSAR
jgi:hypothetical protein